MNNPYKGRCFAMVMTVLMISPAIVQVPASEFTLSIIGVGIVSALGFWIQCVEYKKEKTNEV